MPQKKNPVALEHLKAAAAMVQGAHHAAMACTKNTAFADVNDAVTAVNEPVLDAALRSRRILALFQEVMQGLSLNKGRMEKCGARGFWLGHRIGRCDCARNRAEFPHGA